MGKKYKGKSSSILELRSSPTLKVFPKLEHGFGELEFFEPRLDKVKARSSQGF